MSNFDIGYLKKITVAFMKIFIICFIIIWFMYTQNLIERSKFSLESNPLENSNSLILGKSDQSSSWSLTPLLFNPPLLRNLRSAQIAKIRVLDRFLGAPPAAEENVWIFCFKYIRISLKNTQISNFFAPAAREKNHYFGDFQSGNTSF